MNALARWWQLRNPRERRMLMLMFASLAAFVLFFGLWRPLERMRSANQARYLHAANAHLDAREQLALLEQPASAPLGEAERIQALRDSAARHGLAITRHAHEEDGRALIVLERATPAGLWPWLDELRERHALVPETLRLQRRDGALDVQAGFAGGHEATP
ncbi:type II secretion system protein GspM [Luteimonas sp. e5]